MRNIPKNTKFHTTASHKTTVYISHNNNKLVTYSRRWSIIHNTLINITLILSSPPIKTATVVTTVATVFFVDTPTQACLQLVASARKRLHPQGAVAALIEQLPHIQDARANASESCPQSLLKSNCITK